MLNFYTNFSYDLHKQRKLTKLRDVPIKPSDTVNTVQEVQPEGFNSQHIDHDVFGDIPDEVFASMPEVIQPTEVENDNEVPVIQQVEVENDNEVHNEPRMVNEPMKMNGPRMINGPKMMNGPRMMNGLRMMNGPRIINDPKLKSGIIKPIKKRTSDRLRKLKTKAI